MTSAFWVLAILGLFLALLYAVGSAGSGKMSLLLRSVGWLWVCVPVISLVIDGPKQGLVIFTIVCGFIMMIKRAMFGLSYASRLPPHVPSPTYDDFEKGMEPRRPVDQEQSETDMAWKEFLSTGKLPQCSSLSPGEPSDVSRLPPHAPSPTYKDFEKGMDLRRRVDQERFEMDMAWKEFLSTGKYPQRSSSSPGEPSDEEIFTIACRSPEIKRVMDDFGVTQGELHDLFLKLRVTLGVTLAREWLQRPDIVEMTFHQKEEGRGDSVILFSIERALCII